MENAPNSSSEGSHGSGGGNERSLHSGVREQDRYLPIANISRIMKSALPANAKISKDGKDMMQECVSEFISFVTSEASEKCQKEKRKTINGDDLLCAMATLGFEDYLVPLRMYLEKYREGDAKGSCRGGNGNRSDAAGIPHGGPNTMMNQFPLQGSVNYVTNNGHEQHMMYDSVQDQDHEYNDDASTF